MGCKAKSLTRTSKQKRRKKKPSLTNCCILVGLRRGWPRKKISKHQYVLRMRCQNKNHVICTLLFSFDLRLSHQRLGNFIVHDRDSSVETQQKNRTRMPINHRNSSHFSDRGVSWRLVRTYAIWLTPGSLSTCSTIIDDLRFKHVNMRFRCL